MAVAMAGCAAGQDNGAHGGRPASAGGCTAIAARAARGQATLTVVPAPCRGLGPAQLSRTVRIAVSAAAGRGTKSWRRHLAIQAYRRLAVLSAAADQEAAARRAAQARRRAASPPAAPVPAPATRPLRVPAGVAALAAWLLAAASGGLLVLRRLARPSSRPPRTPRPLPPVLLAHLGFALAGLAVWAAYLLTGLAALAWAALVALLPVAGLGMATLLLAIPDPKSGRPATSQSHPRSARPPVLLIAAHGTLATITILLALLGAVAAVASH